jgi:hypothetical protein
MSAVEITLSDGQLVHLADLVAERLQATSGPSLDAGEGRGHAEDLLTAAELAEALGVHRQTIYQRGTELGGERVGSGPNARWRFDLEKARAAMARCGSKRSGEPATGQDASPRAESGAPPSTESVRRRRRLPNGLPPAGSVLADRGRKVGA